MLLFYRNESLGAYPASGAEVNTFWPRNSSSQTQFFTSNDCLCVQLVIKGILRPSFTNITSLILLIVLKSSTWVSETGRAIFCWIKQGCKFKEDSLLQRLIGLQINVNNLLQRSLPGSTLKVEMCFNSAWKLKQNCHLDIPHFHVIVWQIFPHSVFLLKKISHLYFRIF